MAKRKQHESSEEESASESEIEQKKPISKSRKATASSAKDAPGSKQKTLKKPKIYDDEEDVSDVKHTSKVKKTPVTPPKQKSTIAQAGFVDLGKKRRASVSVFKGTPLVDIREFYGDEGDLKPGKKGISLTLEQWNTLKGSIDKVDDLFKSIA